MIWDNAPYHKSKDALKMLERLRVPIMYTGPYSYDAAPCELFFAAFKMEDVNPNKLPMGKKNFKNVIDLVAQRC